MRTFKSPRNRIQAESAIGASQRRVNVALAPYLDRAVNFHNRDIADPEIRARYAERTGVHPDEVEDGIDRERSVAAAAIVELLVDLQHYCYADNIPLNGCYADATEVFGMQVREAARFILYGRPDEPPDGGG